MHYHTKSQTRILNENTAYQHNQIYFMVDTQYMDTNYPNAKTNTKNNNFSTLHYHNNHQQQMGMISPNDDINKLRTYNNGQTQDYISIKRSITPEIPRVNNYRNQANTIYPNGLKDPNNILSKADKALQKSFQIQEEISPTLNKTNRIASMNHNDLMQLPTMKNYCTQMLVDTSCYNHAKDPYNGFYSVNNQQCTPNKHIHQLNNYDHRKEITHSLEALKKAEESIKISSNLRSAMQTSPFQATIHKNNNSYQYNACLPSQSNPGYIGTYAEGLIARADESMRNVNSNNIGIKARILGNMIQGDKGGEHSEIHNATSIRKNFENQYAKTPTSASINTKKIMLEPDENAYDPRRPNFFENQHQNGNKSPIAISNKRKNISPIKNIQDTKDLMNIADQILKSSSQNRLVVASTIINNKNNKDFASPLRQIIHDPNQPTIKNKIEMDISPKQKMNSNNQVILNNNTGNIIAKGSKTSDNHTRCQTYFSSNINSQFGGHINKNGNIKTRNLSDIGKYTSKINISGLGIHNEVSGLQQNKNEYQDRCEDCQGLDNHNSNKVNNNDDIDKQYKTDIDITSKQENNPIINDQSMVDNSNYQTNDSIETQNFAVLIDGPGSLVLNHNDSSLMVTNDNNKLLSRRESSNKLQKVEDNYKLLTADQKEKVNEIIKEDQHEQEKEESLQDKISNSHEKKDKLIEQRLIPNSTLETIPTIHTTNMENTNDTSTNFSVSDNGNTTKDNNNTEESTTPSEEAFTLSNKIKKTHDIDQTYVYSNREYVDNKPENHKSAYEINYYQDESQYHSILDLQNKSNSADNWKNDKFSQKE